MSDCIFCKIISGEILAPRVYENERVTVINDMNPAAPVHALVMPKEHIDNIMAVGAEDAGLLRDIHDAITETAKIKGVSESGFRLISNCGEDGRQTVRHLHFHIVGGRQLCEKSV